MFDPGDRRRLYLKALEAIVFLVMVGAFTAIAISSDRSDRQQQKIEDKL